jgi:hypothetical protein
VHPRHWALLLSIYIRTSIYNGGASQCRCAGMWCRYTASAATLACSFDTVTLVCAELYASVCISRCVGQRGYFAGRCIHVMLSHSCTSTKLAINCTSYSCTHDLDRPRINSTNNLANLDSSASGTLGCPCVVSNLNSRIFLAADHVRQRSVRHRVTQILSQRDRCTSLGAHSIFRGACPQLS